MNKYLLAGASSDGMTSQAMQQGGMGLILTTLILTAPPMAAMFFQGTLGSFMAYSQIGGSPVAAAPSANGQPPGSYTPSAPTSSKGSEGSNEVGATTKMFTSSVNSPAEQDPGRMGIGNKPR